MTPHIKAKKSDFAKVVLMPGDPLRAKWIADNFLTDVVQINDVRGMLGFTGKYQNKRISVMGHGMGNPSMGIYSYELFNPEMFDVDTIIRVGSCGSLDLNFKLNDVIIADQTYSESSYAKGIGITTDHGVLLASSSLVTLAQAKAKNLNIATKTARSYASDVFYNVENYQQTVTRTKAAVVEMEAFALYANAIKFNKQALVLLTVSDSLITHESMSADQRQTGFKNMIQLGLDMAVELINQ
ncbi:Purine nucleoside phosphorylase [[Mycoplasma] cavipharyngis]|uniref:purine-nucleoside phosphorylase n=1 Tax=[Mycoplasma] cavipharyngis TaxID=92757 RepID=UPI003704427A